jgi:uncharacterized protein (TIGR03435 family)
MRVLASFLLLAGVAIGQSADKFEVADVHESAHTRNPFMKGPFVRGGFYEVRTANMADLISVAFGVDYDRVVGGPSWLEMDRFDITAKAPHGLKKDELKPLLKALLEERFKLVVHEDTRPIPAFALTVGKHPALKKSEGSGDTGCKMNQLPPGSAPVFAHTCSNVTMATFAEALRQMPAGYFYLDEQAIVDRTDLKGNWDFNLKYTFRGGPAQQSETVTIFDALEKQLGLKLEPVKVPMQVIVVDAVNQKPTGNVAGIAEILHAPPIPTEFEVAEVKPNASSDNRRMFRIQRGGRVNLTGMTLKSMIQQAWNVSDDMLVGAPKWLDEDRFDVVAKAPAEESADVDFEAVLVMMRGLLKERFKLAVHYEDRPLNAYTLMAGKPKMKKADPSSRTMFKEGAATDAKDPRNANPALSRLVTVQNMTMAQFADQLQGIAPGYIKVPVLDATGLEGGWDFTLSFSPAGLFQAGRGGGGRGGDAPVAPSAEASEPTGGLTLPEAIEKQLGLKLVLQKRTVPVLVIDRVEQRPTEN